MRVLNAIFAVCAVVNHMYFLGTMAQQINGQCPVIFEENSDAAAFGNYCQRMAFSLARIVPDRYRWDICYSKCFRSETCVYFSYEESSTLCIVCLRRRMLFPDPRVGSTLNDYDSVPQSITARIGVQLDVNACDFLDYNCASKWFGGFGGNEREMLVMDNGERITSLRFCTDVDKFGGFDITIDENVSHRIGCGGDGPVWKDLIEFAENELITEIKIYYDDLLVKGLRFKTNLGHSYEEFGLDGENAQSQCILENVIFEGGDLSVIEWKSGAVVDGISFQFQDCD